MRKLKLQMVMSLDGFVKGDYGGANIKWDNEAYKFCIDNLKNVDCILLGRNTAEGFIPHWKGVANNPKDSDYKLGKPLTDIPKIVFSKKLKTSKWDNATIAKRHLVTEIKALKKRKGKDMIVYGGYTFVSLLIQHHLIDEYFLLVNPVAYGSGEPIFNSLKNNLQLKLEKCKPFACGIVLLHYKQRRK
jgi:dihydrofolate reductase